MGKSAAVTSLLALLLSATSCASTPAGISVTPSAARSQIEVPNVEGLEVDAAINRLTSENFDYRVLGSDGVPVAEWPVSALVEKQSIGAANASEPGATVEVTLKMTAAAATAQSVKERTEASAAAAKEAAAAIAAEEKAAAEAKAKAAREEAAAKAAAAKKTAEEKAARERNVTYLVEADGTISMVTYTNFVNNQMGQEQSSNEVMGPVKKVYKFDESDFGGQYGFWSLGVNAQAGANTSTITCRILLNGRELAKQTSTGPYSVVSCNAGG